MTAAGACASCRVSPYRRLLWPTVFTIPALALLIGLGIWQVQRLHWKEGLLAHIDAQMRAPAVELPAKIDDPASWEYRRVRVTGHYQNDKELYLYATGPDGDAGYLVLTPLVRAEGPPVLIDRGWVPEKLKDPATRQPKATGGRGRDRRNRADFRRGGAVHAGQRAREEPVVLSGISRQMSKAVGEDLAPVMVDRDKAPLPGGWPLGRPDPDRYPEQPLGICGNLVRLRLCPARHLRDLCAAGVKAAKGDAAA